MATNYFDLLPPELMELVFSHAAPPGRTLTRYELDDHMALRSVCHRWRVIKVGIDTRDGWAYRATWRGGRIDYDTRIYTHSGSIGYSKHTHEHHHTPDQSSSSGDEW